MTAVFYPDCEATSPNGRYILRATSPDNDTAEHTDGKVVFVAPFLTWSKSEVYEYFLTTGIDVSVTYSCEAGTIPVCGRCASCRDRKALGC